MRGDWRVGAWPKRENEQAGCNGGQAAAGGPVAQSPLEAKADCDRCAALCCMALAFDTAQGFAIDKPNGVACPHLAAGDRCTIHDRRADEGFAGCVTFDCGGVGQYVTETVFAGRHWRGDDRLAGEMTAAFSILREVAALAELLEAAARWPLAPEDEARRLEGLCQLWPAEPWTPAALRAFAASGRAAEIRSFLRSLRRYVAQAPLAG